MKVCKQCGEEHLKRGKFCGLKCQQLNRASYQKQRYFSKHKKKEDVGVESGKFHSETPCNIKEKNSQKQGSVTFSDSVSYEQRRFITKTCCNMKLKVVEGMCFTLSSPVKAFEVECGRDCNLFNILISNIDKIQRMEKGEGRNCRLKR